MPKPPLLAQCVVPGVFMGMPGWYKAKVTAPQGEAMVRAIYPNAIQLIGGSEVNVDGCTVFLVEHVGCGGDDFDIVKFDAQAFLERTLQAINESIVWAKVLRRCRTRRRIPVSWGEPMLSFGY
jgi:hypothetical protein